MTTEKKANARFAVTESHHVGGSKIFSRGDVSPGLGDRATVPGDFLGRLWAHFGAARAIDNGFSYAIRDRETGLGFEAYSGASGPAYGAAGSAEDYRELLVEFEAALAQTELVECAIEYLPDSEYGPEMRRMGVRKGEPFDEIARPVAKRPKGATSYEECLSVAKKGVKRYGLQAAWELCLDKALPPPPESFRLNARRYENCVGFTISSEGTPVFLFDEGPGIEEIPARAIPFEPPLSDVAKLWLDSFDRWYAETGK